MCYMDGNYLLNWIELFILFLKIDILTLKSVGTDLSLETKVIIGVTVVFDTWALSVFVILRGSHWYVKIQLS